MARLSSREPVAESWRRPVSGVLIWLFGEVWETKVWDEIAKEKKEARYSKLTKMMAERAMLRNLMVLLLLLSVLGPFGFQPMASLPVWISALAVVALVVAYYRMDFLCRLTANGKKDTDRK